MSTGPSGLSQDPDRIDPDRIDPDGIDPDQVWPQMVSRTGGSLPELLGKAGAQEEERNNYVWLAGLLAVFAFLGAVAFVFAHLSPS